MLLWAIAKAEVNAFGLKPSEIVATVYCVPTTSLFDGVILALIALTKPAYQLSKMPVYPESKVATFDTVWTCDTECQGVCFRHKTQKKGATVMALDVTLVM